GSSDVCSSDLGDESSDHRHRNAVGRNWDWCPVFLEFPKARPDHPCADQGDYPARQVHHRRSGEIHMPVSKTEILSQRGQPASSPNPVSEEGINDRSDQEAIDHERGVFPPFRHCARWDCRSGIHENHLEQEQCEDAYVVRASRKEESRAAEESEVLAEYTYEILVVWPRVASLG